jgi:D-alanyl-D-alanine carboxypeptidase
MKLIFSLIFAVFVSNTAFIFAQDKSARFPATPLGNIAGEWVGVVNQGDETQMRNFIKDRFSSSALKNQNPESLLQLFRNLQKQGGGLEVVSVNPNSGELPMFITIKSKKGNHYASVILGLNAKEGKLAGMGITRIENPNSLNWPEGVLTEKEMLDEIRRRTTLRAAEGDFSGVLLVARDDRILLHEAFGYADREARIPNTTATRFHLASVGKMFTSAAIATLVRAGKLSYEDTVAKLLPDYPNQEIARKINVHQLLTHSAGMGTFFQSPGFKPGAKFRNSTEEIAVYKDEPLFFEPGTKWRYSNAGYSLLGAIIERVSGKNYLDYIRENVLKPLRMNDTGTNSGDAAVEKGAVLYQPTDVDPFGLENFRSDRGILMSPANAFGGGFSTAEDLFKFARAYRTGKFLGRELTEKIITPKVAERRVKNWGYGIKETIVNGETVRGHSGGGRADLAILWNSGYTVIVLANVTPPTAADLSAKIVNFITKQEALRSRKTGRLN